MNIIELPASTPPDGYVCLYKGSFETMLLTHSLVQIARDTDTCTTLRMLQVRCPHCSATPLNWCTQPSGRDHQVLHSARLARAIADRWWLDAQLKVPDVILTKTWVRGT